ncbi:MAG: ribosome biogenesis GTP-binding protein YihA/YsxC [Hydrotalea sp.]|nr:ribosome biogenesis GTP-binding protein YihA/YsxC [Hydrotalea sp.]
MTKKWESYWHGGWQLLAVAAAPEQLPMGHLAEVAFWGRSNVGKSSLINNLVMQKNLARQSKSPGRTQELFFFEKIFGSGERDRMPFLLVDLPGYGFARAARSKTEMWQDTILAYLSTRPNLRLMCLLIDARHGLKTIDLAAIQLLFDCGVTTQLIFTKCDKVPEKLLTAEIKKTENAIKKFAHCLPSIITTSAHSNLGKGALQNTIATLLG